MEQTEKKSFALWEESKDFAVRSIRLYQYLTETAEKREYNLSKQFLMAGTRIGDAFEQECYLQAWHYAKSAKYWLDLIYAGGYLTDEEVDPALEDVEKLSKVLYVVSHPEHRKEKSTVTSSEEGGAL